MTNQAIIESSAKPSQPAGIIIIIMAAGPHGATHHIIDAPGSASGEQKCAKLAAALAKSLEAGGGKLDLSLTGSKENNALVSLLKCDAKALKKALHHPGGCDDAVKRYDKCHASVMGTGMFEGRKGCAKEADDLRKCVHQLP